MCVSVCVRKGRGRSWLFLEEVGELDAISVVVMGMLKGASS